ncbi:hypothetical protein LPJ78_003157 [Coemansia sp. RSA 989]|nr:hypothetical protein BX667DRAFT_495587 [Coemansia mojavensis]KAJ1742019.1 hypothetical protein LPJ68_002317 [Coemansia sp. RSA 1086]KAJ1864732.1 hypothetical protein LPJ78_003157 [Coemansia sp. RSA 989]KAJ1872269.1 hypothetical protein LPJ55_003218 [Coemansia sp. RSA 990]KAJ2669304.1 hypothetical protein IWW42_004687 [Coemansia sp. RSA 1085]
MASDAPQQSPPRSAESSTYSTLEIPNENENDGQYVSEFWLNALVPKPHTNFFGYESSIGPICISISTRESHECYKALVRTPFKFGVVYVPTMVIDEPIFGTDLDRLSTPTPQKILLYHALRLYFQQADDERCGYLLTALRNQRLAEQNAARVVSMADTAQRKKRGLQRSGTKRSIELRRAEISDFMDGLFHSAVAEDEHASIDGSALQPVIQDFLASERAARDLAVATESLTEIRDDHLKPLLRNLEPRLYRRRLRIDFVVVGAQSAGRFTDTAAPHRRFLRTLERVSARMRGEPNTADSPQTNEELSPKKPAQPAEPAQPAKRKKTREELEAKRNNVVQELIATERSYVEKLRALIDIYAVPLRSAARSANNSLIPAYDAHVIFGNIERVAEVNERFLGDLEAWQQGEMDPKETIGSLCRDHFVDFHVYKRYINGYQHALTSSRELEARNPLYAAFLQKAREREECRKLGISDLLIMPVQRIPRYTLLLTDLLKVVPDDDPDVARIQLALERVNEIGQLADNQVTESVEELHRIHTSVEGCPPNLISASREFVGAVDVSEIDLATGAPKRPMCLLVFSDLLMIVERFWPPRGHGGIRVTGQSSARGACPAHGSGEVPSETCTCAADAPAANAFLSTTSGGPAARKKWGRFTGWVDVTRVSILEKSLSPSSRSFFIHRYPGNDAQGAAESGAARRHRAATSAASSIVSLDSASSSPNSSQTEQIRREFARILYPSEPTYESYGDPGYWYPQSLHEFETDHAQTRDSLFEFLNTAWERAVARCFEAGSTGGLSRHSSSGAGHRKTRSGVDTETDVIGHPELDRVDVGGQSWTVHIWDAADYARSRENCPSALHADITVVWDYQHVNTEQASTADMAAYPHQACRVVGFDDDYFHVTSTMLPLDAGSEACAELVEERDVADSWPVLCRMVEQAVVLYQYVLLAYPEHRRVQQCYNRSILASLFGQNALGSSSSVKTESAAPRKLFSRAKHLFSSTRLRASPKEESSSLFLSAYSNASDTSSNSNSTVSTPLTVLGRYKLKTKSSTVASTRRTPQRRDSQRSDSLREAPTTPTRSSTASASLTSMKQQLAPPSNKRKGSDMSARDLTVRINGRRPAHTIDEVPLFSSSFGSETADIRMRSRTTCSSRRRSSSVSSSKTSPAVNLQSNDRPPRIAAASTVSDNGDFGKRRSMSVVSAASLRHGAPPSLPPDDTSEFSLQLDFRGNNDSLGIPSDLKLEFDQALRGAGSTPPPSTRAPASELQYSLADTLTASTTDMGASSSGAGLNLLIPADRSIDAKDTWEVRSPDDRAQTALLSSADSLASRSSARSLNRRCGVYGGPLKTSASVSPSSASAPNQQKNILLDIARELGEDFSHPPPTSPLYVDDDAISHHLSQMSMAASTSPLLAQFDSQRSPGAEDDAQRPLPMPPHSRGPSSTSPTQPHIGGFVLPIPKAGPIPQPPPVSYNLQQSPPVAPHSDYRRLPDLPPRVRSAAAPTLIDRNSVNIRSSVPGRSRPAHPPF